MTEPPASATALPWPDFSRPARPTPDPRYSNITHGSDRFERTEPCVMGRPEPSPARLSDPTTSEGNHMQGLIGQPMRRGAAFSDCGRYRYRLGRAWDETLPAATFIMLNPSTADGAVDDPTIRRCIGYARAWGCGSLSVVNLYAWRATDPAELTAATDPVGPANDDFIAAAATVAARTGAPLVAAWGAHARPERIAGVLALPGMSRLTALACTKSGQPRHPLYLPAGLTPRPWSQP